MMRFTLVLSLASGLITPEVEMKLDPPPKILTAALSTPGIAPKFLTTAAIVKSAVPEPDLVIDAPPSFVSDPDGKHDAEVDDDFDEKGWEKAIAPLEEEKKELEAVSAEDEADRKRFEENEVSLTEHAEDVRAHTLSEGDQAEQDLTEFANAQDKLEAEKEEEGTADNLRKSGPDLSTPEADDADATDEKALASHYAAEDADEDKDFADIDTDASDKKPKRVVAANPDDSDADDADS